MKKIFLAAVAVCALLAGCSKENTGVSNESQSIMVQFPKGTTFNATRAVEESVTNLTPTQTLSNPVVFLLNGNSVVSSHDVSGDILNDYVLFEDVSSTVNGVLVVANITTDEVTALKALNSSAAIESYAFTISSQATAGIDGKTMIGKAAVTAAETTIASKTYKTVTVALNSLIARFEIGDVKAGTGIENIELVGVWINSYYTNGSLAATGFNNSESEYWKTSPAAGTPSDDENDFATITFNGTTPGTSYSPSEYYSASSSEVTLAADSKVYAFHLFAGENIPHVIMLVKGEFEEGHYTGNDRFFLGWVTFTNYLDGGTAIASIAPNTIYRMGIGTAGVVVNANEITTKPEEAKFNLAVECTIADWTSKTVTPSVN